MSGRQNLKLFLMLLSMLVMAGCATTPPDPGLLDNARSAIAQAEAAGASEYAPLELRFARERLNGARFELERNNATAVRRLADEAEIEAQLALARTQAALTRADLAQRQRDLEQLKSDLLDLFGPEFMQ